MSLYAAPSVLSDLKLDLYAHAQTGDIALDIGDLGGVDACGVIASVEDDDPGEGGPPTFEGFLMCSPSTDNFAAAMVGLTAVGHQGHTASIMGCWSVEAEKLEDEKGAEDTFCSGIIYACQTEGWNGPINAPECVMEIRSGGDTVAECPITTCPEDINEMFD